MRSRSRPAPLPLSKRAASTPGAIVTSYQRSDSNSGSPARRVTSLRLTSTWPSFSSAVPKSQSYTSAESTQSVEPPRSSSVGMKKRSCCSQHGSRLFFTTWVCWSSTDPTTRSRTYGSDDVCHRSMAGRLAASRTVTATSKKPSAAACAAVRSQRWIGHTRFASAYRCSSTTAASSAYRERDCATSSASHARAAPPRCVASAACSQSALSARLSSCCVAAASSGARHDVASACAAPWNVATYALRSSRSARRAARAAEAARLRWWAFMLARRSCGAHAAVSSHEANKHGQRGTRAV